jgi:hypothetical protein
VKILSSVEVITIVLSSAAILISGINLCLKFVWDYLWKIFCNKIYKNLNKLSLRYFDNGYGQMELDKLEAQQSFNLFYTICSTFLEERKELFINNKINRDKLKVYILNFEMVAKFLIDYSKNKITNNKLKTDILDYKFISCLSINTPDQQSYIDEEYISRFYASNSKRHEFQNIVRLKGLTFDEVIKLLNLKVYINIAVSTCDFLNFIVKDKLFIFNAEKRPEKYNFKYIHNLFCKKFEEEVLDYEKKFNHDDILKTMCVTHNEDHWIPVGVDTRLVKTPDKPYWNIDHYADEGNHKSFVMKNNKIYDETLKQDLDYIYENRKKYKSVINNSKFYRDIFGEIQ